MGKSADINSEMKCLLVLKDGLSNYCWLKPTHSANAEHVAKILAKWIQIFSALEIRVSDQRSHLKNEVISEIARTHHMCHHQTVAYSSCANGTVESSMKSILSASGSLLAELKLAPSSWMTVVSVVATALSYSNLERLGQRPNGLAGTSLEVITEIQPEKPILQVLLKDFSIGAPMTVDLV